jgi:hypothetical protein
MDVFVLQSSVFSCESSNIVLLQAWGKQQNVVDLLLGTCNNSIRISIWCLSAPPVAMKPALGSHPKAKLSFHFQHSKTSFLLPFLTGKKHSPRA